MEKCKEFIISLGPLKGKTDIQVINLIKEKVISGNEKIIIYFEKYVNNFAQIKTIQSLMNNSDN